MIRWRFPDPLPHKALSATGCHTHPQVMPPYAAYLMTFETWPGFSVHWRSRLVAAASLLLRAACEMARVVRASSRDMNNCGCC